MNPIGVLEDIALQSRDLLRSLRSPTVAPLLAGWPDRADSRATEFRTIASGPEPGTSLPCAPLPVLRYLKDVANADGNFGVALVAELCRHASSLAWRQTYAAGDIGDEFLGNYGYTEIVGPASPLTAARIACGFLLLGPSTVYPLHRHEAEEIYVPLSGTARWRQADSIWREQPPGTLIHHAPEEPHAMHTGVRPLLALYVWRSEQLNQKARLDAASGS